MLPQGQRKCYLKQGMLHKGLRKSYLKVQGKLSEEQGKNTYRAKERYLKG